MRESSFQLRTIVAMWALKINNLHKILWIFPVTWPEHRHPPKPQPGRFRAKWESSRESRTGSPRGRLWPLSTRRWTSPGRVPPTTSVSHWLECAHNPHAQGCRLHSAISDITINGLQTGYHTDIFRYLVFATWVEYQDRTDWRGPGPGDRHIVSVELKCVVDEQADDQHWTAECEARGRPPSAIL